MSVVLIEDASSRLVVLVVSPQVGENVHIQTCEKCMGKTLTR
jgi:hypothetical protein